MERITNAEIIRSVRFSNAPTMMIGDEELAFGRSVELLVGRMIELELAFKGPATSNFPHIPLTQTH
jgi:hypothetical protein